MHTIFTQSAHTQHRNKQTKQYAAHTPQQRTEHRRYTQRTEHTIQNTENNAQNSAHNYRTYSFDLYHEQIYIKNSNTIELYTISKENI